MLYVRVFRECMMCEEIVKIIIKVFIEDIVKK